MGYYTVYNANIRLNFGCNSVYTPFQYRFLKHTRAQIFVSNRRNSQGEREPPREDGDELRRRCRGRSGIGYVMALPRRPI